MDEYQNQEEAAFTSGDAASREESTEAATDEMSAETRQQYLRMLADDLNRSVDDLETAFFSTKAAMRTAMATIPEMKRIFIQSRHMALRSEWFRERANGRRIQNTETRRQTRLWEIEYRWQEFLLFLRRHRPARRR